ncbi:MAG TPA: DUF4065 domain-containing protein [Firmicutes bacterium]|nr:DUF4065 domain-containing protein [Bacillota bacterium]
MDVQDQDPQVGYCCNCDDDVSIFLKKEIQENEIRGIKVSTLVTHAYCKNCGEEVYIAEINNENLKLINQKYREENDLICVSDIQKILKEYDIGAKPLSLLLGWGEVTILRYLKGQMPHKEHSDKLKAIMNPYVFAEIFESNKEVLSAVAKRKVEFTLRQLIESAPNEENAVLEKGLVEFYSQEPNIYNGYTEFSLKKTIHSILYFLEKCGPTYKTKMNKLLWFSDMLNYKRHGHSITGLRYLCHHFGPVPVRYDYLYGCLSDVYVNVWDNEYGTVLSAIKKYNSKCFSDEELKTLNDILDACGTMSAAVISELSHKQGSYKKAALKSLMPFSKDISIN